MNEYDWADLAFSSKKPIKELHATFFAAFREMSSGRFIELVKRYLVRGPIVLGVSKEKYVVGFEGQPQFRMAALSSLLSVIDKVNARSKYKIYVVHYYQREAPLLYEKLHFRHVVLINGSWQFSYHTKPDYYALMQYGISYTMESPFVDEDEARSYEARLSKQLAYTPPIGYLSESAILQEVVTVAHQSYDTSNQVGAVLARRYNKGYKIILTGHNTVVPYQTHALHVGASRERHFSPPGDQNYYDAVHDVITLLVRATKSKEDISGTILFANVLPCPTCARALCLTDIEEIVYSLDHSDGYAIALLEAAGKKVRRVTASADVV